MKKLLAFIVLVAGMSYAGESSLTVSNILTKLVSYRQASEYVAVYNNSTGGVLWVGTDQFTGVTNGARIASGGSFVLQLPVSVKGELYGVLNTIEAANVTVVYK